MRTEPLHRKRSPLLPVRAAGRFQPELLTARLKKGIGDFSYAAIFVSAAAAARYFTAPFLGPKTVYMLFYPAVILGAWFGGIAGGLVAVALSAFGIGFVLMPEQGGVLVEDPIEAAGLVAYIVVSSAIAWGTASLQFSRAKLAQTAEELTEKESRFQALFDILPVGISIAEDAECRIIRHNPTLTQWLGHAPDINASLLGPRADELGYRVVKDGDEVSPESLPMPEAARAGRKVDEWEGQVVRTDGRVIHILGYATPLFGADGKVEGCLGTYVDITEVRKAEEERRANLSEIETLNAQLQRSVSETHHRVKNNLQVITALLNMELLRHEKAVPPENVGRIVHHVQSLAVIHDLLTHQSKESAQHQLVSAKEALGRLVPLVAGLVVGRRIVYKSDDVDLTPRQATALAILVNELIGNAIKHGAGDIRVRFCVGQDGARLEVEDGGAGFPAGFEAARAANTGLELVETVARWDLQGETRYENRPDGGARVTVDFPL